MNRAAASGPVVAVGLKTWATFSNHAVAGILRYAREHNGYEFRDLLWSDPDQVPSMLERLRPKGAILGMNKYDFSVIGPRVPDWLPLVSIGADTFSSRVGVVCSDDRATMRLAMEHLHKAGYNRIAFAGWEGSTGSARRAKLLQRRVPDAEIMDLPMVAGGHDYEPETAQILEPWIKGLKGPVGVIAWSGPIALHLCKACANVGRSVPADVGILSLADDQFCLFADPPISAMDVDGENLGYQAMALMASLLKGEPVSKTPTMVPPKAVIARESTGSSGYPGWDIDSAMHFIEQNACRGITVESVVTAIPGLGRTRFYSEFTARVGVTPADYIRQIKLERAKQLLTSSRLSIERIASMCGFSSATQFGETFKREVGAAPLTFRRQSLVTVPSKRHKTPK